GGRVCLTLPPHTPPPAHHGWPGAHRNRRCRPYHSDSGWDPNSMFPPAPDKIAKSYFWSNSRNVLVVVVRRLRKGRSLPQSSMRVYGTTCSRKFLRTAVYGLML